MAALPSSAGVGASVLGLGLGLAVPVLVLGLALIATDLNAMLGGSQLYIALYK